MDSARPLWAVELPKECTKITVFVLGPFPFNFMPSVGDTERLFIQPSLSVLTLSAKFGRHDYVGLSSDLKVTRAL